MRALRRWTKAGLREPVLARIGKAMEERLARRLKQRAHGGVYHVYRTVRRAGGIAGRAAPVREAEGGMARAGKLYGVGVGPGNPNC